VKLFDYPWIKTARAWLSVHQWRPALCLAALAAMASLAFGRQTITLGGSVREGVPLALVVPAVLALAIAVAAASSVAPVVYRLTERPFGLALARLTWIQLLGMVALALALIQGRSAGVATIAVTANLALYGGLALLPVAIGRPEFSFFPVFVCLVTSFFFAGSQPGRWGFLALLSPQRSVDDLLWALALWFFAAIVCAVRFVRLRPGRPARQKSLQTRKVTQ
jgi:hypothetical protein